MKSDIQVGADTYYNDYDTILRFISYHYQIENVLKLRPQKCLEIGIGNRTVSNYLLNAGVNLTTCDFDKDLKPDVVADIRELPFKDNEFDVIMACEIIEHLPWEDVVKALEGLQRVSSKYVYLSIPYACEAFETAFRFPGIKKLFDKRLMSLRLRIPHFWKKNSFDGQHYWELGRKSTGKKEIRKLLSEYFIIKKEIAPAINQYQYAFVLEVKKTAN